jgi:hypothetical protein
MTPIRLALQILLDPNIFAPFSLAANGTRFDVRDMRRVVGDTWELSGADGTGKAFVFRSDIGSTTTCLIFTFSSCTKLEIL